MNANALIQARINKNIKEEAAGVLDSIGLTISDAIRLLLTRIAHDRQMPFELLKPNEKPVSATKKAQETLDQIKL